MSIGKTIASKVKLSPTIMPLLTEVVDKSTPGSVMMTMVMVVLMAKLTVERMVMVAWPLLAGVRAPVRVLTSNTEESEVMKRIRSVSRSIGSKSYCS